MTLRRASLVLGVIYLTLQAFPVIFGQVHRFNVQMTGLSFIGIGVGMCIALATQPYWIQCAVNRCVARYSLLSASTRERSSNMLATHRRRPVYT